MALYTTGDIITEFLVRNNISTTDGFVTDTMLRGWIQDAHIWASSAHKWPFTEGRISTTYTGSEEIIFEGIKSDSIRLLQIGGKRHQKLAFEDYQIYRENVPQGNDKVYSDAGRILFVNPYTNASGTLTVWAQYQPTIDATDLSALTVFSGYDEEGNEAIIEKMKSYYKVRTGEIDQSELSDNRAKFKLEEVWGRIEDEQYGYQPHESRGGMFSRIDIINGLQNDEVFKRDQFL